MKKVDEIFIDKASHKGTLTELFGIDKTIDKTNGIKAPVKE